MNFKILFSVFSLVLLCACATDKQEIARKAIPPIDEVERTHHDYTPTRKIEKWSSHHIQNYELLHQDQQKVVNYILEKYFPLLDAKLIKQREKYYQSYLKRKHLPVFVHKGIFIAFLKSGQLLVDLDPYKGLKGKTVAEVFGNEYGESGNRLMDTVAGDGSRRSVVTEIRYVPYRIHGWYNMFYHEFAHLLHQTSLTKKQLELLDKLYQKAKVTHHFQGKYASVNEAEYFAEGFEAYNTNLKSTHLKPEHARTREYLRKNDPGLYDLIHKLSVR